MKRKYIYPLLVILLTILFYYAEQQLDKRGQVKADTNDPPTEGNFYYLPTSTTNAIVSHRYYTLSYAEKHEQPEWVAYHLKKEHLSGRDFKRPYFEIDKKVATGAADWRNYKKSGYDRGHLCPAGDRKFSYDAYAETFLTSNIAPQDREFNAGVWNDLEKQIRYWVKKNGDLYIVTGGMLTDTLGSIGHEAVSVPKYFYKIILDNDPHNPRMLAFMIPNTKTDSPPQEFIVSVDDIEKRTGIDFFPALEDALENRLEASVSKAGWKFFKQ